jgi:hypothetical protein
MAGRPRKRARRGTDAVAVGVAGAAAVVVAASAAGVVAALAPTPPPVAVAAATVPVAVPWVRSVPSQVTAPGTAAGSGSALAGGTGMAVPQPPRPTRTGLVVTPFVGIGESPVLTPRPAVCGGHVSPRQVPPGVVPGPGGTATVSWQAGARPEVLGYRVSAVSQTLRSGVQAAPRVQTAAEPADCAPVTLTFTGLTPGDAYVFWLEERTLDETTSVERLVQIGTSQPVVIAP